jgi:hypothetical protein
MRLLLIASGVLMVASCGTSASPDCAKVRKEWPRCLETYENRPDLAREFFLNCLGYSEPQRIAGTWARDFEFNEFYEGQRVPFEQAWQFRLRSIPLLSDVPVPKAAEAKGQASVAWIEFEGRRPLCDVIPEDGTILVDRIYSMRVIEARPSKWQ